MVIKKIKKFAKNAKKKYDNLVAVEEETIPKPKKTASTPKLEKRIVKIYPSDIAKGVVITILLVALSFLIFQVRDIIMLFFVSLLFAAALDPTIDRLQKFKIPRSISTIIIFIILIGLFSLFIGTFIPVLANQIVDLGLKVSDLVGNIVTGEIKMPFYLEWLNPIISDLFTSTDTNTLTLNLQNYLIQFGEELRNLAGNALIALKAISNGLANAILVMLLTYFMIVDEQVIDNFVIKLFPSKYESYIVTKSKSIKSKVGEWLRGQIGLGIAVGIITYIGLVAVGIEYAFTLALFAGLTELIPVLGPVIAWIAAVPIAANQSMNALIWVSVLYFTIQRLENNLLVPLIMKQATGLHPIVVLFAMLIGFEFYGILGIIISVPVSAVLSIFLNDYLDKSK
jgi:predicted PurR-regulated permease PerM